VRAAQTNLQRLDDLTGELAATLSRLRREARQAAKYKGPGLRRSARLKARLLHMRWPRRAAPPRRVRARGRPRRLAPSKAAAARPRRTPRQRRSRRRARSDDLRDEATAAAAVLHHVDIEADAGGGAPLEAAEREVSRPDRRHPPPRRGRGARRADVARRQNSPWRAWIGISRMSRVRSPRLPNERHNCATRRRPAEAERARAGNHGRGLWLRGSPRPRPRPGPARPAWPRPMARLARISATLEQVLVERLGLGCALMPRPEYGAARC